MLELILYAVFARDVAGLASESYAVREAASQRLARHHWLTWRMCDRPFPDLEQRRRAEAVVRMALRVDPCPPLCAPFIDVRMEDFGIDYVGLSPLGEMIFGPGPAELFHPSRHGVVYAHREAKMVDRTRDLAITMVRMGLPPAGVQLGLDCLQRQYDLVKGGTQ